MSKENSLRDLEAFVDCLIEVAAGKGYRPTDFIRMRGGWGTVAAIERLLRTGDIQSGFQRLCRLGLQDWSLEAAVLKFPDLFGAEVREAAAWRLGEVARVLALRPKGTALFRRPRL